MLSDLHELGIEPLDARSVVLSALLGSTPPELPARALVSLAELFGVRSGTVRTALSRMVAAGDLVVDDSRYRLTDRLLDRRAQQDSGRRTPSTDWDGTWWSVLVETDRRSSTERRAFRSMMLGARFGELRPDIWLRPANAPAPPPTPGVLVVRGSLGADDVHDLVARLWPLGELETRASLLHSALHNSERTLGSANDADLPATFTVAAAVVRFLRSEPQLPAELQPDPWTASAVRSLYADFSVDYERRLREFFSPS